jgi:hypothetical protein
MTDFDAGTIWKGPLGRPIIKRCVNKKKHIREQSCKAYETSSRLYPMAFVLAVLSVWV